MYPEGDEVVLLLPGSALSIARAKVCVSGTLLTRARRDKLRQNGFRTA